MERVIVISVFLYMMMAALHVAHAVVFTILGEKCVWLIKSYRELPKEKRKCYDADLVVRGEKPTLFVGFVVCGRSDRMLFCDTVSGNCIFRSLACSIFFQKKVFGNTV